MRKAPAVYNCLMNDFVPRLSTSLGIQGSPTRVLGKLPGRHSDSTPMKWKSVSSRVSFSLEYEGGVKVKNIKRGDKRNHNEVGVEYDVVLPATNEYPYPTIKKRRFLPDKGLFDIISKPSNLYNEIKGFSKE